MIYKGLRVSNWTPGHFGALLGFLKFLLTLAVFSQVQGGDLFSFLNLLLVGLDLLLELVSQVAHAILVLAILLLLELQFFDTALSPLESLVALSSARLDRSKLHLQFADSHFQLSHGVLASFHCVSFSIGQADFQFTQLGVKCPLGSRLSLDMILFSTQFIGKPGSINHSPLGFLL